MARDFAGRFIPNSLAALWADTCENCRQPKADHDPDPNSEATSGLACRDDQWIGFQPSNPFDCMKPRLHEPGCDCRWGLCL